MPGLKRNLTANYLGQAWVAVMGLAFVPVYIRYLGMESYGLIGVFSLLQTWLALLDMGITPTLNREMARFKAGAHTAQSIGELLRSLEVVCFGIAALIGVSVWAASDFLARDWLRAGELPVGIVAQAVAVMAWVVALRFVEGVYRGSLFGLQKQVWYNAASALLATIRHGGAVAILAFVSPTVWAFFVWQGVVSILTTVIFAASVHRALPRAPSSVRFSRRALTNIGAYAGGMLGITLLSLILTQVDKVILSRMLDLAHFGYYTLAATVAGTLYMVIAPITQSLFPRMVELSTRDEESALITVYHLGAQLVTVLTGPAMLIIGLFSAGAVYAWSGDGNLAQRTAPILSALALGTFLNGLMWIPHQCQLAHGWTSLALKANLVAVAVLVPAILWVVPRYGAVGAGWLWVALNTGYVLIALQFMHARLLRSEKWAWYLQDVVLPLLGAGLVSAVAWQWQPGELNSRLSWISFLLVTGSGAMAAAVLFASHLRGRVWGTALSLVGATRIAGPRLLRRVRR